jgi:hypothetical protein
MQPCNLDDLSTTESPDIRRNRKIGVFFHWITFSLTGNVSTFVMAVLSSEASSRNDDQRNMGRING